MNHVKIRLILVLLLTLYNVSPALYSCTIFFVAKGDEVFAGNNEDWIDPQTKMWFYPASDDKYGWIKFGFGSGFPQGGINEHGLFWDGSSCAYLDMPYSENNKEKLDIPIMQKVIEECTNVEETLDVFNQYYHEDQYKAQYLVGDANGKSIIVEGDKIVYLDSDYQILTNFYHSHTDLGGFPCWRYEMADEMLFQTNAVSPYLIGSVLDATHQEGKYPTQYSNIYDLKHGIIYLFQFHNFEEFIKIELTEELKKGKRFFNIPLLFSKIKILSPSDQAIIQSSSVSIRWEGITDNKYELIYGTDPELKLGIRDVGFSTNKSKARTKTDLLYFVPLILLATVSWNRKLKIGSAYIIILCFTIFNFQCKKDNVPVSEKEVVEMVNTLNNLSPDTTYYWKIKSHPPGQDEFITETTIRSFKTGKQ